MLPTNDIAGILKQYYQSFIKSDNLWTFFLGIADYVKYIIENPEIGKIISKILAERDELRKTSNEYEKQTLIELGDSEKELLKIIKDNNLVSEELSESIRELEGYKNGGILSSKTLSDSIDECLFNIARHTKKIGSENLVKKFIDSKTRHQNVYGNFVFSKTLEKRQKHSNLIEEKEKIELWGAWDNLILAYTAIFKGRETHLELITENRKWHAFNWVGILGEMRKIKDAIEGKKVNADNLVQFSRAAYTQYVSRIHNHILNELSKRASEEVPYKPRTPLQQEIENRVREIEKKSEWKKEVLEEIRMERQTDNVSDENKIFREGEERLRQEKEQRERIRIQRIAASGKSPLLYSLERIIEKCLVHAGAERVEIYFYDLGFNENMPGITDAHRFFIQLKDFGCFEDVERAGANEFFVVTTPNTERLKEYRNKLENVLETKENQETEVNKAKKSIRSYRGIMPKFNVTNGDVILENQSCHIADIGDYQYHLCKILLADKFGFGERITETYIEDIHSPPLAGDPMPFKSQRWVRDAVYKINGKIHKCFGIKKFVEYRGAKVRIIKENFE